VPLTHSGLTWLVVQVEAELIEWTANEVEPMIVDRAEWQAVGFPGYAGKAKSPRDALRDKLYGRGNWKTAFVWGDDLVERDFALQLYEDAYYEFFRGHPDTLQWLCKTASDVYDNAETNIDSGHDYSVQEADSIHLQDIAIRRSLIRLGRRFLGDHLVEVRGRDSEGYHLNPGQVPFHIPEMIQHREGNPEWIRAGSIEDFWQSNKVLVVRKSALRPILAVDVIVVNEDGGILLIDRSTEPAGWALPGGKVEYGESLRQAAEREVAEETGLQIDIQRQFAFYDAPERDPRHHFVSAVFLGKAAGSAKLSPGNGIRRARFFSQKGLPDRLVCDHQRILNDYFAELGN
jgi:ADP-ribose pyrophosphatase YjhB (NUDIX family)